MVSDNAELRTNIEDGIKSCLDVDLMPNLWSRRVPVRQLRMEQQEGVDRGV